VTGLRPHTKSFSQEARDTLGVAFGRAREAAGYPSRPAFAKASGVGKTSLYKLESGIPVSASVYEAAARAIPGWTEDTPIAVLAGEDPPSTDVVIAAARDAGPELEDESSDAEDEVPPNWTEDEEQMWTKARVVIWPDLTRGQWRIMQDRYLRLQAAARRGAVLKATEQATQGDRS
jgi:hypothetical protein